MTGDRPISETRSRATNEWVAVEDLVAKVWLAEYHALTFDEHMRRNTSN